MCNFLVHHLQELAQSSSVTPAVNQVEFHPFLVQKELLAYGSGQGIRPEAWATLTRTRGFANPVIASLAAKYGRTPAQIIPAADLSSAWSTIPESVHRERIEENSRILRLHAGGGGRRKAEPPWM